MLESIPACCLLFSYPDISKYLWRLAGRVDKRLLLNIVAAAGMMTQPVQGTSKALGGYAPPTREKSSGLMLWVRSLRSRRAC